RNVADAMLLVDEAVDSRLTAKNTSRTRWQLATVAALVAVVLVAVGAFYARKTSLGHVRAMQLTIVPPGGTALRPLGGLNSTPAIAPDDSAVVFAARDGLRIRRLDALGAELIHGTEGVSNPAFWSPDALSIAFPVFNVLRRIRLPDGAPETITTL